MEKIYLPKEFIVPTIYDDVEQTQIFGVKGDFEAPFGMALDRISKWKLKLWQFLRRFKKVEFGARSFSEVRMFGDRRDLKVKFVSGKCVHWDGGGERIEDQRHILHTGLKYVIEYGDPVRMYNLEYLGEIKESRENHFLFRSGNCCVHIGGAVYVNIISVEDKKTVQFSFGCLGRGE